jgi:hypothetical protein
MALAAVVLLALAAYAQVSIPAHTKASRVLGTRLLLAGIGIALGAVTALSYPDAALAPLAFLVAFGMVHFPAALVLFFKHLRGEGRS